MYTKIVRLVNDAQENDRGTKSGSGARPEADPAHTNILLITTQNSTVMISIDPKFGWADEHWGRYN